MKRTATMLMTTVAIAAGAATAIAAPKPPVAEHASHAPAPAATPKLTLEQARAIALHARPGEVTDHEIETEAGGSGLRYAFDIRSGATTYEVGVDANTGQVLENSVEDADPD